MFELEKIHNIVKTNSPKSQKVFYKYMIDELSRFAIGKYNKVTHYFEEFLNEI